MSRIFISYSRSDVEFARRLAHSLSEMGAQIWIDVNDIPAGMKWSSAIQQGLNVCQVMLVIISPDSMASTNVEDEWQYYMDEGKPVIPLLYRPAEKHFQIRRLQHVDFHTLSYDAAFERLVRELAAKGVPFQSITPQQPPSAPTPLRVVTQILPPPFEWCAIPAGQVTLEAGGYLKSQTTFEVAAFKMAKYPITNAQYDVFVQDGYPDPRWWDYSVPAKSWRKANPESFETGFEGDDLPRTNVNWYSAVAFCSWLSARSGQNIMLPNEQQWQWAAQGKDGRKYPWGNEPPDKNRANFGNTVGKPTPVTQYPNGESPFHVMDMSGNVWEWCLNDWRTGEIDVNGTNVRRVVRGGSWDYYQNFTRAAYRDHGSPDSGSYPQGFRVCAAPN